MNKELKEKCARLTATFETSRTYPDCFGVVAGNFDGAGISLGFIQYNLRSCSLQPILRKMFANHDGLMKDIFKDNYQTLKDISQPISTNTQVEWGDSITDKNNNRLIISPWREQLSTMGKTKECQEYQIEAAERYFIQAEKLFKELELYSERGYALCFDIAVQNWTISKQTMKIISNASILISRDLPIEVHEIEKMKIIAEKRSQSASLDHKAKDPYWKQKDVLSRKMCIATGSGNVHGIYINLDDYNITLNKA